MLSHQIELDLSLLELNAAFRYRQIVSRLRVSRKKTNEHLCEKII